MRSKTSNLPDIRSDILPEIERKYGETFCFLENNQLVFRFQTAESALLGTTDIAAYLDRHDIPGNVTQRGNRTAIMSLGNVEPSDE